MFKYFDKYLSKDKNDVEHYFDEFDKEVENNSDRGIVLICGSIIDILLSDLLKSFLIKKDNVEKKLFGTGKALGTFDAKINMAFYLGLISENEFKNISYIQRTRNKFAHQVIDISFENDSIVNICSNFNIPKNSFRPQFIPFSKEEPDEMPSVNLNPIKKDTSAKERFIFVFKYILINLLDRIYAEDLGSREEYSKEYTADESIMLMPNKMMDLLYKEKEMHEKQKERLEEKKETLENMKDDSEGIKGDKSKEEVSVLLEEVNDLINEYVLLIKDSEEKIREYQDVYEFTELLSRVLKNSVE